MIHPREDPNAIITPETTLCGGCALSLSQETRETLLTKVDRPAPEKPAGRDRRRSPTGSRARTGPRAPAATSSRNLLIAITAAGIAAGLLVVVLLARGGRTPSPPPIARARPVFPPMVEAARPPFAAAKDEAVESRPTDDAARLLAEARPQTPASLDDYGERRAKLGRLVAQYPGTEESREAQQFIDELDEAYAASAEKELALAIESSDKLIADGRFEAARSILRAMGRRFGEGPWFESRGKARVDASLAAVDRAQTSARAAIDEGAPDVSEDSFVMNGSMSEGDATPLHWEKWDEAVYFRDKKVFRRGPASLCVRTPRPGVAAQARQIVELKSHNTFRLTGTMRSEGPVKTQTAVQFFSADWQQSQWIRAEFAEGTTDWKDFSKDITPPAWAGRYSLLLLVEGDGAAWLDEVAARDIP